MSSVTSFFRITCYSRQPGCRCNRWPGRRHGLRNDDADDGDDPHDRHHGWQRVGISAFIGLTFGLLLGGRVSSLKSTLALGTGYGMVWWVLGGLLIMPAQLGMPILELNATSGQSLMGHMLYGVILGGVYALAAPRLGR